MSQPNIVPMVQVLKNHIDQSLRNITNFRSVLLTGWIDGNLARMHVYMADYL